MRTFESKTNVNGNIELLILDGQQRLTALLTVFAGYFPGATRKPLDIRFNIDTEKFQVAQSSTMELPWVSVTGVLNSGAIATAQELQLFGNPNVADYIDRLNRLERIKEYTYQVYILRRVDYQQVTDIFQRVNSKGTRLQQSELAIAQLAFALPGLISDQISSSLESFKNHGFNFHLPIVIRCFHAVLAVKKDRFPRSNFQVLQTDLKDKVYSDDEILSAWKDTRNAIQRLINILTSNLGIQSSEWLPSENALVIPVLYLAIAENPDTTSMLRWFLYASMWQRYSGATETALDQDFQQLFTGNNPGFKELLRRTRRDVREEDLERATIQSPFRTMLYLACRHNKAQDWSKDQIVISATGIGDSTLQVHHIYPTAFLQAKNKYAKSQANQLANLAFISRASNIAISKTDPAIYLPELYNRDLNLLRAHYIPEDPRFWTVDRFQAFLRERRTLIAKGINDFMTTFKV